MSLKETIETEYKNALKSKDKGKISTYRLILSSIKDLDISNRSGPNKTNKARRMMYLTYNAKKDGDLRKEYFKNKRISYPPNIERIEGKKYKYLI